MSNLTGRTVGVLIGLAVSAYTRSFWKGLASAAAADFVIKKMGYEPAITAEAEMGLGALVQLGSEYLGV